jgi:hypothetical protein
MAYLRTKKFKRKKDKTERAYFYIVEAKRIKGKVQQKVLRYLGTTETILKTYRELDKLRKKF